MTTWQELAATTLYRFSEWQKLHEQLEAREWLGRYWEPVVVEYARRGYSPESVMGLIYMFEAAREREPELYPQDWAREDQLANYSREFLDRMHKHDRWIPWVLFVIGLLVVCVAVAELLLAVTDAR